MTVQGDRPLSRRELRDRAQGRSGVQVDDEQPTPHPDAPSPAAAEPERWFPPEQESGSRADAESDSPSDGWNRPLPSDLTAPERTMTRRELRILRERAEAAGQPAPDVVFLPSGEATVTGMIPVVGPSSTAPALAPEADAAGVVTERPVSPSADVPDSDAPDSGAADSDVAEPEAAAEPESAAEQPTIPALIEPLPSSGVRFRTDAGRADATSVPDVGAPTNDSASSGEDTVLVAVAETDDSDARADAPADGLGDETPEIVLDAEPVTGPVEAGGRSDAAAVTVDELAPRSAREDELAQEDELAEAEEPAQTGARSVDVTAPAPSSLRPFDASFRRSGRRADTSSDEVVLDNSAAPLSTDAEGMRGDILFAPDSAARTPAHWSDGADAGADEPTAFSRDVGVTTGAVTTHALVLPTIPDVGDPLLSPLTSTGEIMVTGTIDLPRSFGSTGAHPALFDHPEVDALLDESDREDADSAAAPVRASRAVSSTTTTRAMIDADDGRKSRLLPIVLISSLVVGVAAAAFLVAAFVFNVI